MFPEVIAFAREETKKKKKVGGKPFLPSFWDNADVVAPKAHEALSVDNPNPLMAKSFGKVVQRSDVVSHLETHASMC